MDPLTVISLATSIKGMLGGGKKEAPQMIPYQPYEGTDTMPYDPLEVLRRARRVIGSYDIVPHRSRTYDQE